MADASSIQFELDRPFYTNGKEIPANTRLSSEDLRDLMADNGEKISSEAAKSLASELIERQKRHNQYMEGIHEKHEHMGNAGTIAMGSGAE